MFAEGQGLLVGVAVSVLRLFTTERLTGHATPPTFCARIPSPPIGRVDGSVSLPRFVVSVLRQAVLHGGACMTDGLVIGTQDIAQKDQLVLRALVRLLEGGTNIRARFSEQLGECNVVFVPGHGAHHLPAPCIAVRVKDAEQAGDAPDGARDQELDQGMDLVVSAPLRMTNVIAVL